MSYSTARTLCTYNLNKKELYLDVIASLLSHLNFIDSSQTNFILSESRYSRQRDFSRSTRIGEMAQGINALFVGKRLDYPYIIDFDLAKQKTNNTINIQTTGKAPDFLVVKRDLRTIGLFESKGTMNGEVSGVRGYLSKAIQQIDAVHSPCFESNLPFCTKFEHNNDNNKLTNSNNKKSSINYGFIENVCTDVKNTSLLIKLHYASWFYLVGDFDRVNSILNEGTMTTLENDPNYTLDNTTDPQNPIYWVKNLDVVFSENELGFYVNYFMIFEHNDDIKIGIYKKVIDNLRSEEQSIFEFPEGETDYLRKYPDGTLIFIKST